MFEGTYAPPYYTDLYNFKDGAQNDIFVDSYVLPMPEPNANQTALPELVTPNTPTVTSSTPAATSSAPVVMPSASAGTAPSRCSVW